MSDNKISNSVLKRKLISIQNDDNIINKKQKIKEIEIKMIENITKNTKLSNKKKNEAIKQLLIRNIQRDNTFTQQEKVKKYNEIMFADYSKYIEEREKSIPLTSHNTISFHKKRDQILGCKHYSKNCKLKTNCCNKWYVCKFCHNEKEYHSLDLTKINELVCMKCQTIQPISNKCINKDCNIKLGNYFCKICKYHNNSNNEFYHCNLCNMCIKGNKHEFKHCDSCNMCLHISIINNHKCISDRNTATCPICSERIQDAADEPMILETCQHIIHSKCFSKYMLTNYKCPVCIKTITDFGFYQSIFDRFDEILEYERDQIPDALRNSMVKIYCNDCEQESETHYHFELHKCQNEQCLSFNTSIISIEHNYYTSEEDDNISEENDNISEEDFLTINNLNSDDDDENNIDIIFIV